jgi:threonine/homoserine/homoserine lactone efflux protein
MDFMTGAELLLFAKGFAVGFIIAMPIGPVAILCAERTLTYGFIGGFVSGVGVAFADALFGLIAALFISMVDTFFLRHRFEMWLIGGAVLAGIGIRSFFRRDEQAAGPVTVNSLLADFTTCFLITITNPLTLVSMLPIFAVFGIVSTAGHPNSTLFLVLGLFLGSTVWFTGLAAAIMLWRGRMDAHHLPGIRRVSGVVVAAFGLAGIGAAFFQ